MLKIQIESTLEDLDGSVKTEICVPSDISLFDLIPLLRQAVLSVGYMEGSWPMALRQELENFPEE
jgi:hypothetical protein